MNHSLLKKRLEMVGVSEVRWLDCTDSTNEDATVWAEEGALDGALIGAEEQLRGRGRFDRRWYTPRSSGLAFSLILRPSAEEFGLIQLFSGLGGVAVCFALEKMLNLHPQVKWPNDVLLSGKKVSGILAETLWEPSKVQGGSIPKAVILGIGINIAPSSIPPANVLHMPATCAEDEFGQPVDRIDLLAQVIEQLFHWRPLLGRKPFMRAWEERLAWRGEEVQLDLPNRPTIVGTLEGLSEDGQLCLRTADGNLMNVTAGEISLRKA